jgi:hypothetical protein
MRSPSWSKDEQLRREITTALAQAGHHDLVKRLEQSRRAGRRPNPELAYRQLARMWESYRRRHDEGTDEELAWGFIRAHGPQINKLLGLKIGRKIDPKKGPWASVRDAVSRGKRVRARIKNRRQSSSQFMWNGFGRQKSSLRVIRLGLGRHKAIVDRATAEYLLAAEKNVLLGEKPIALSLTEYLLAQEKNASDRKPTAVF